MSTAKGKAVRESLVTMTEIVLPSHTNQMGSIFGGQIMSWIDIAAAIAAGRHSRRVCVTASIDALHFLAPVKTGQVVILQASVNSTNRTSMEVGVRVDKENRETGELTRIAKAYLTFVAVDEKGKPTPVPPLVAETPEEKRRLKEAKLRREARLSLKEKIRS